MQSSKRAGPEAIVKQGVPPNLNNKNKELLQSEQQVLKETQVLYTLHEQFMDV
jgi:hypothetical protein